MSWWSRVKRWRLAHRVNEGDAPADTGVAASRETGGGPTGTESTTGTGRNEEFVGRTAGVDEGYAGETGAEAREERKDDG
jgi:hypothetical protein